MGPICCTETSVTTNMRCVTSLKSECLILKHTYINLVMNQVILYSFMVWGPKRMVRCRPTGSENNTRTIGHDSCLFLAEVTFGIKPEAAPLFGLCISVLARFQRTGGKRLSQKLDVRISVDRWYNCKRQPTRCKLFWLIYLFLISSTCFRRCLRPSSGALDCIYSF